MRELLTGHYLGMARQLVDSTVETTRVYWRRKLGMKECVVTDPRPIREIIDEMKAAESAAAG